MTDSIIKKVLEENVSRLYVVNNGGESSSLEKGIKMLQAYSDSCEGKVQIIEAEGKNI